MRTRPELFLGKAGRRKIFLPKEKRSKHMHVIGGTGTGKSNFLFNCIIQDIEHGNGVSLIDPHGELYHRVLNWLAEKKAITGMRKIHLVDLTEPQLALSFNPLKHIEGDITTTASNNMEAISQVWGEDTTQTPRLREVLQQIIIALSYKNLTYLESEIFFSIKYKEKRREFIKDLPTQNREFWEDMELSSNKEYREEISSTRRRLRDFISSQSIRAILGQTQKNIDLYQCMEREEIILVNLASNPYMTAEQSRMIGCLLTNQYFTQSLRRQANTSKPHYLYIDEISKYLSGDIENILAECRKFGLHLILAHQHLGQLKNAGELIYSGVMSNAENKIVFGELNYYDGIEMAQHIFKTINFKDIKHIQKTPTVVGHKKELMKSFGGSTTKTQSVGTGQSSTYSQSMGFANSQGINKGETQGKGETTGEGFTYIPDEHGILQAVPIAENQSTGISKSAGQSKSISKSSSEIEMFSSANSNSRTESFSTGTGYNVGYSETLVPILKNFITSVSFYSLQDQHHRNNEKIRTLATGESYVSMQGEAKPIKIKTPYYPTKIHDFKKNQLLIQCFKSSPYIHTRKKAELLISERENWLKRKYEEPDEIEEMDDDDFLQ